MIVINWVTEIGAAKVFEEATVYIKQEQSNPRELYSKGISQ
jgi:hypothetical protein